MRMKSSLPWIFLSILLGSGLLFQTITSGRGELKTAYVNNAQLYAEFLLSKKLDASIKQVQAARQAIMDSLALQLRAFEGRAVSQEATDQDLQTLRQLRTEYQLKQQQFAEDNTVLVQRYQEQISNQLNQYLHDYTEREGYDYIFGATGAGSLMGAKDEYDITTQVITYANERYKGMKK